METLSPHVLSVIAMRDNSAAIRKHARDALLKRIEDDHGINLGNTVIR
jgi:hypothetical protein